MQEPTAHPEGSTTAPTTKTREGGETLKKGGLSSLQGKGKRPYKRRESKKAVIAPEDKQETKEILEGLVVDSGGDREGLKGLIDAVLEGVLSGRNIPAHTRTKIADTFASVLTGKTWREAMRNADIPWAVIGSVARWCPAYSTLLDAVQVVGRQAIKHVLEGEAVSRAVDGWEEPQYQGGKLVGTVLRKSDRLLECLLKAHDPSRYNPQVAASQPTSGAQGPVAVQVIVNVPGASGKSADITPTITVTDAETPDIPA